MTGCQSEAGSAAPGRPAGGQPEARKAMAGAVERALASESLEILGGFRPGPGDGLPESIESLALLGPREPGFWDMFEASPERRDGRPDPMDRWSRRAISRIASDLGAEAYFPFGKPLWPFFSWALRTGRCWQSPAQLLVHDTAGLMVSFRGALGFRREIGIPAPAGRSPCETCAGRPCLQACPAGAISEGAYAVAACKAHLEASPRGPCMARGCLARASCPVSASSGRREQQSAFHMRAFMGI